MSHAERGIFICLEGGEGCGKTTMADLLATYMSSVTCKVETVADPGSTVFAQKCREILLDASIPCNPAQQALLYTAARNALAEEIRKKLHKGINIISGRWVWSTLVYQGDLGRVGLRLIELLHQTWVDLDPDIYILLDADPAMTLKRKADVEGAEALAKDRFESMDIKAHERIREGYRSVAMRSDGAVIIHTDEQDTATVFKYVVKACNKSNRFRQIMKD